MRARIRRRIGWSLGIASLAAVAAIAIASVSDAAPSSLPLHGYMRNISNFQDGCPSVTTFCSRFNASGSINGDGLVQVDTFPNADGFSKAHTVIHTAKGDLTCHEAALFSPPIRPGSDDHAFVDLCLIDGSTGAYAGATGYIQEVGTFNFHDNIGQLEYYGELILGS